MAKIGSFLNQPIREFWHLCRISLFIVRCPCCGEFLTEKEEHLICHDCRSRIMPYREPVCEKCGKALLTGVETCGECLLNPPPFHRHVSFARYEGVLREVITLFKFREMKPLKKILIPCLTYCFRQWVDEPVDWVIPVPADRSRKRELNPILEVSRGLSRELGVGLLKNNLIKVRKTRPQVKLTRSQRLKNLDGAFSLRKPGLVEDRLVLLVDDVYTTGTTIRACSRQLKKAGAEVLAITLARSI